jgi:hypothetical protein
MSSKNIDNTAIDWEEIILKLQSFTRTLVNGKGWFRGGKTKTFLKGKEIEDYIFGAIEKYLRNPEKHDPLRGSLIDYLKFNLIRSMVSNDLVSAENKTSKNYFAIADNKAGEEDNTNLYLDTILPCVEAYFDQEIDYKEIMNSIETEVKGDKIAEEIFLGVCCYNLKRREVIEEFKMTEIDFDNGMRRLKTILNNTAKKYDLNKQSV